MSKPQLFFYLDLHSPYAYVAFRFIRPCEITYVPVQLVGFVKAGISLPPWGSQNKVDYMWRDISRWCQELHIPWQPGLPANFPLTKTSEVQRAVTACSIEYPDKLEALLDALYHAFWFEKKGVQLTKEFEPIITQVLGHSPAERVIDLSKSEEVQRRLRQNTSRAMTQGACGLPWFKAVNADGREDVFWGFDHLGQVARFLGLEKLSSHL